MQLLIPDRTYPDYEGDPEVWYAELRNDLESFEEPFETTGADIGPGADWPMVLAIFGAAGSLFLLGDKIEKNIDAWSSLARRFSAFVARLRAKYGPVRVDVEGARLLAAEHLLKQVQAITSLARVSETVIPITPFQERDSSRLDARYDALYILAFVVDGTKLYVLGIKSSGAVEFSHEFGSDFMTF